MPRRVESLFESACVLRWFSPSKFSDYRQSILCRFFSLLPLHGCFTTRIDFWLRTVFFVGNTSVLWVHE